MKQNDKLGSIADINELLTTTEVVNLKGKVSQIIFANSIDNYEIIIRQFLLSHLCGAALNRAILCSLGKGGSKVLYPMPLVWRSIIKSQGYKVSKVSSLLWVAYVTAYLCYGIFSLIRQNVINLKSIIRQPKIAGNYVYFDGLSIDQVHCREKSKTCHNIVSWYRKSSVRIKSIDKYCHNVSQFKEDAPNDNDTMYVNSPIFPLSKFKEFLIYLILSGVAFVSLIRDVLFWRWWNILMLKEASLSLVARIHNPKTLAREYLFNNSSYIYRPLWTYEAEAKGSKITLYFYSTNCELFKNNKGVGKIMLGYQAMTWPYYLVWDKYQKDFIYRAVGKNNEVLDVGCIWFTSNNKDIDAPLNSISVFDVPPYRQTIYILLGAEIEYYVPEIVNQFLNDIQIVLNQKNISMLHKQKRVSKLTHKKYIRNIKYLNNKSNYVEIDPSVDAFQVIQKVKACISMPFTSTALIARSEGKPSIYYDPSGIVQKDDKAAHGIPILSNINELEEWVENINNE